MGAAHHAHAPAVHERQRAGVGERRVGVDDPPAGADLPAAREASVQTPSGRPRVVKLSGITTT